MQLLGFLAITCFGVFQLLELLPLLQQFIWPSISIRRYDRNRRSVYRRRLLRETADALSRAAGECRDAAVRA